MRNACGLLAALAVCGMMAAPTPIAGKAPTPPPEVPPEAVKAVQAALPKGWTAASKGDTITVRREKKVGLWNPIGAPPLMGPPTPTEFRSYEITLRFRPRITAKRYEELREENEAIGAKLEAMREGLRAARITHKFDDWIPSTPEQKKLVAEYRAAQKAMPFHRLPDFYTETRSIDISNSIQFPLSFTDPEEAKECERVREKIGKLFKPYERQ